ncbi:MAG: hypothetical protein ACLFV3_13055, partial [Phycisphaeraceae bacterium]
MSSINSHPRNRAPQTPQIGTRRSLAAPGLVPTPPSSIGARKTEALAEALGIAAGVARLGQQAADQEIARRNAEARQVAAHHQGQAALDAKAALPEILQKIEERELLVPDGVKVEAYARQYLDEQLEEVGAPEPYAEAYRGTLLPTLVNAWTQQQQGIIDQARRSDFQVLQDAAVQAGTVGGVRKVLAEAKKTYPTMAEVDLLESIVVPAMHASARAGDVDGFAAAADVLGDRFAAEQQAAEQRVDAVLQTQETRAAAEAGEQIRGMITDGRPLERVREKIMAERQTLGEEATARLLGELGERAEGRLDAAQNAHAETIRRRILLQAEEPRELRRQVLEAIQRPASDPQHLPATTAQALLNQLGGLEQNDDSRARILARLRGENATLTDEDEQAVMDYLRSPRLDLDGDGQARPLIDENGNPTHHERLAMTVGQLGLVPSPVVDWMDRSARSGSVEEIADAGQLYWLLDRVAPAALDQADSLHETAELRLQTIADRINRNSPPSLKATGEANPAFLDRLEEEARRVLKLDARVIDDVSSGDREKALAGVERASEVGPKVTELLRQALPGYARRRTRTLFGIDSLWPDAKIEVGDLPPTFSSRFRKRAGETFITLREAGWPAERARKEAAERALDGLRRDYLFPVMHDQLFVLPRYDNPADLQWTESADEEWRADFEQLRQEGRIDEDASFEDWRPITQPQTLGVLFAQVDDPLTILTDQQGEPIRWRPRTLDEQAREEAEDRQLDAAVQAEKDGVRVARRKRRLMKWVLHNRKLR